MAPAEVRRGGRIPYWAAFATVTLLLGGGTAAFVLGVLPRRFVLQAGFRESGMSFPSTRALFTPPKPGPVVRPPPRPPEAPPPTPGPAERMWSAVSPLLEAGRYEEALPILREYLDAHPGDTGALREYAHTLVLAGRGEEALGAYRKLARRTGRFEDRLALARLLRDRGETGPALAAYDSLRADRPGDLDLAFEEAQALSWAGRREAAVARLRDLLPRSPEPRVRIALAQELAWNGQDSAALAVLSDLPDSVRTSPTVADLRHRLVAASRPAAPEEPAAAPSRRPLERARDAVARDDLQLASSLYDAALRSDSTNAAAWKEWADLLQFRLEDYAGAARALRRYLELSGADGGLRLRLARLEIWSGHPGRAREELRTLLAEHPERADGWALLGDLRRWDGEWTAAASAYDEALSLDPTNETARAGRVALAARRERVIQAREPSGVGPAFSLFLDSDDFRRADLAGAARWRLGRFVLGSRGGYRTLRGHLLDGSLRTLEGGFAEMELARWWRQATIRTSLTLGAENLPLEGTQAIWGAGLQLPEAGGFSLRADYRHGPAYPLTRTLESVAEPVSADELHASAYRRLGNAWVLQAAGGAALFRSDAGDDTRWDGSLLVRRRITGWLSAGYVTRWLGFESAAPSPTGRRLFWDPSSFWSHQLLLEASAGPSSAGWSGDLGLRPGFALLDERGVPSRTVPQLEVRAGLRKDAGWGSLGTDLFYGRARENGYESFGAELQVRIRTP